ncbi:MAG: serine/threonine-protein kinase [Pirellulaceae bacterium]|nr:serine/threonine-protein kinase [Pirellulaceae bacterium]
MNAFMQCLTEEELIAYLSGDPLSAEKTTHIQDCQQCQQTRDQIQSDLDAIRAVVASSLGRGLEFSKSEFLAHSWDANRDAKPNARIVPASRNGRLPIGMSVGNYTVIRLLGRGGQSEAYLVRQSDKGEDSPRFVLKVTRETDVQGRQLSPPQRQSSFATLRAEEETLYKLQGIPGTLQYVTAGQVELGTGQPEPYLVTDYVRGQTLHQRAAEFADPQRAVALVAKIAEVMSRVHRIGVIHGDLKPQNIMLGEDDSPTVIDFGLARIRDVWNQGDAHEAHGGTLQYMAPEQAAGDHTRVASGTDVFALGAILQQLVTGQKLYEGEDWKTCLAAARSGKINIAELRAFGHPQLRQVVVRCLSTSPEHRYANGSSVAEALRGLRFSKISRWHFLGGCIVALLTVATLWWFFFNQPFIALPNTEQPMPEVEAPILGLLGSDDANIGDWNTKLPVVVGNSLRVAATGPTDTLWFLVWIDGTRAIYVYATDSPENPLLKVSSDDGSQEQVVWPGLHEETMSIGGSGGTELLMLIGFPGDQQISENEIKETIQSSLTTADSWPEIPEKILIRFDDARIQSLSPSGTIRGPGEVQPSAYRQVESTIKVIRESIGKHAHFVRGEVFRVNALD